tara:strand:+ start:431 stop:565 length:135 start_codon:yes stop_codon:yes gene_type:complete
VSLRDFQSENSEPFTRGIMDILGSGSGINGEVKSSFYTIIKLIK